MTPPEFVRYARSPLCSYQKHCGATAGFGPCTPSVSAPGFSCNHAIVCQRCGTKGNQSWWWVGKNKTWDVDPKIVQQHDKWYGGRHSPSDPIVAAARRGAGTLSVPGFQFEEPEEERARGEI